MQQRAHRRSVDQLVPGRRVLGRIRAPRACSPLADGDAEARLAVVVAVVEQLPASWVSAIEPGSTISLSQPSLGRLEPRFVVAPFPVQPVRGLGVAHPVAGRAVPHRDHMRNRPCSWITAGRRSRAHPARARGTPRPPPARRALRRSAHDAGRSAGGLPRCGRHPVRAARVPHAEPLAGAGREPPVRIDSSPSLRSSTGARDTRVKLTPSSSLSATPVNRE